MATKLARAKDIMTAIRDAAPDDATIARMLDGFALAVANDGRNDVEGTTGTDRAMSGTAILNLAASDAVDICVRTISTGTPNITVDYLNLTLVQIGA
jgi:hypothetical protein